jgi:hypothetical protein
MNATTMLLAVCMMLLAGGSEDKQISLGFAHFQTVKAAQKSGVAQSMYPDIIVRVTPQKGAGESFLFSNEAGVALMPLRPGNYCFDAYNRKGSALRLDSKQATCFSIIRNETTEVGVVIQGE